MKAREQRRKVMLKARLRIGAAWRDACILDLSSRGMMIQASDPPRNGSYVEIRRGRHVIIARVMWTRDRRCGLRTQDVVPAEAITAEPDHAARPEGAVPERRVARAIPPRRFDHERSRWWSRACEFTFVVLIGGTCGAFVYRGVSAALSSPLNAVQVALAGG